jgi:hypothetical protein
LKGKYSHLPAAAGRVKQHRENAPIRRSKNSESPGGAKNSRYDGQPRLNSLLTRRSCVPVIVDKIHPAEADWVPKGD